MNNKISLIYCTCDKYESLWPNYFYLLKKYWPTFDSIIVFNSESKAFSFKGLKIIKAECPINEPSWSERLYYALDSVVTPYVLLSLDDFYLKAPVDEDVIEFCINKMEQDEQIKLFTFGWQPGNNKPCEFSELFEERVRFAPYRVNAQFGLWRVSYLRKIIHKSESPWEFELNGSFRSSIYGGKLYSLKKNSNLVFDYDWGFLIVRGKINKAVADYFVENESLEFDDSFEELNMDDYNKKHNSGWHSLRKVKYVIKMIFSLFRK